MSKSYISKALRERVEEQAQHRCGYCLSQEEVVGAPMEIDHLLPEAFGGLTLEENLWLACTFCNSTEERTTRRSRPWPTTFESGAAAGYLNPAFYEGGLPPEYVTVARAVIAHELELQAADDGLVDLTFFRVFVLARRP